MKKIVIIFIILSASCCFEQLPTEEVFVIMSWNVQNLFDGVDDGSEYSDYSVAEGRWSRKLYERRLKYLSKIILLNNPDVVALQEIEGENVLIDFKEKYLESYRYHSSTSGEGAIQLGVLSKVPIKRVGFIDPNKEEKGLRVIQEVTLILGDNELTILNNHWKSKRGGFSEHLRVESAKVLKRRLLELKDEEVIVVGDLNENYNEYQKVHKSYDTALMYKSSGEGITINNSRINHPDNLYTPWPDSKFPGSYRYRGEWETIDHILLNRELMNKSGLYFRSFYVDSREELVNDEYVNKWDMVSGRGYSDHLPIFVRLGVPGVETSLE